MNRIKELREEKGWTQDYLGSLLNVKNAAISKYENGRAALTDATLLELTKLFNVSFEYLLGLTPQRNFHGTLLEEDKKILVYYNRLDDEYKDIAKGYLVTLFKEQQIAKSNNELIKTGVNNAMLDDDIIKEVESYRQELILKKNKTKRNA